MNSTGAVDPVIQPRSEENALCITQITATRVTDPWSTSNHAQIIVIFLAVLSEIFRDGAKAGLEMMMSI